MRKNYFILLFFFFLSVIGCKDIYNKTIEEKIVDKIKNCDKHDCEVNISLLTDFKWDKMWVIDYGAESGYATKIMGVDYSKYYEEFTRPIIFLYKNKIVHYENNDVDIENVKDQQINFPTPNGDSVKCYNPKTAIFKFKTVKEDDRTYYELSMARNL